MSTLPRPCEQWYSEGRAWPGTCPAKAQYVRPTHVTRSCTKCAQVLG